MDLFKEILMTVNAAQSLNSSAKALRRANKQYMV